ILLIGDAGEPSPDYREPVLDAMEKRAMLFPEKTLNIFLGDNVYPFGLETEEDLFYTITKSRLDEQINIMKQSGTEGVFIPGNHDWGDGGLDGWDRIVRMGKYIDANKPDIEILPKNGCPGPEVRDYGEKVRVIFLDSQWWLHNDLKPDSSNYECSPISKDDVIDSVDNLIKNANGRFVIIAAHHPLESYGPHGGFFDWKAHIFPLLDFNQYLWIPLPVIGSFYPLLRMAGVSSQDMSNSTNKDYVERIKGILSKYNNIIYAAGHEHSLQVIKGMNNNLYLVSGYGTAVHSNTLSYGDNSIFSVLYPGFIQLDVLNNNTIRMAVFIVNTEGICEESFSTLLFNDKIISNK
ncbi:MAG: hypothetical protein EHM47_16505, partial [Ignavibacteriales bacterium]